MEKITKEIVDKAMKENLKNGNKAFDEVCNLESVQEILSKYNVSIMQFASAAANNIFVNANIDFNMTDKISNTVNVFYETIMKESKLDLLEAGLLVSKLVSDANLEFIALCKIKQNNK